MLLRTPILNLTSYSSQVRRLVAVLSVRGVSRAALLDDSALGGGGGGGGEEAGGQQEAQQGASCASGGMGALREVDAALLEACGLSRAAGLRSLVNFSGGCQFQRNMGSGLIARMQGKERGEDA